MNIKKIKLRYGENPNQNSFLFSSLKTSILKYQLSGKKMSYNNISKLGKYFRLSKSPPIFIEVKNEILIDKKNNKYLDFACGSGTTVVGHNNKHITENLKKILMLLILHFISLEVYRLFMCF